MDKTHTFTRPTVDAWQVHGARPWTRLLVHTEHSRYELRPLACACLMVMARGGRHLLEPCRVLVAGARLSCREIRLGTIRVGCRLELHAAGAVILTSPVRRIELVSA